MNLDYIYAQMPDHIKQTIKGGIVNEHVRILFYDTMQSKLAELQYLDTDLPSDIFKLQFMELKKSVMAYKEILTLIDQLK